MQQIRSQESSPTDLSHNAQPLWLHSTRQSPPGRIPNGLCARPLWVRLPSFPIRASQHHSWPHLLFTSHERMQEVGPFLAGALESCSSRPSSGLPPRSLMPHRVHQSVDHWSPPSNPTQIGILAQPTTPPTPIHLQVQTRRLYFISLQSLFPVPSPEASQVDHIQNISFSHDSSPWLKEPAD